MQGHDIERRFDCAVSRVAHQGIPGKNVPIMYGRIDNTVGRIVEVVGGPGHLSSSAQKLALQALQQEQLSMRYWKRITRVWHVHVQTALSYFKSPSKFVSTSPRPKSLKTDLLSCGILWPPGPSAIMCVIHKHRGE